MIRLLCLLNSRWLAACSVPLLLSMVAALTVRSALPATLPWLRSSPLTSTLLATSLPSARIWPLSALVRLDALSCSSWPDWISPLPLSSAPALRSSLPSLPSTPPSLFSCCRASMEADRTPTSRPWRLSSCAACASSRPSLAMRPCSRLSSASALRRSAPAPAWLISPPRLSRLPLCSFRSWPALASTPWRLSVGPLMRQAESACPLCTILPWRLSSAPNCRSTWAAASWPLRLSSWPSMVSRAALAALRRACCAFTSPAVWMSNAPWLALTVAWDRSAWPARKLTSPPASSWPLACSAPALVTASRPWSVSLPSAWAPAASAPSPCSEPVFNVRSPPALSAWCRAVWPAISAWIEPSARVTPSCRNWPSACRIRFCWLWVWPRRTRSPALVSCRSPAWAAMVPS
ncbi:hypothetical protein A203_14835 [Chromobacterium violaceum]